VVVASIDTYLKYSEAVGQVAPASRPQTQLEARTTEELLAENAALRAAMEGRGAEPRRARAPRRSERSGRRAP
jgi:hypothetical protein